MWNVKNIVVYCRNINNIDLIDTLWNVKQQMLEGHHTDSGRFNRYIVECKAICDVIEAVKEKRFNRYIVECKGRWSDASGFREDRFNRYIVECKGF